MPRNAQHYQAIGRREYEAGRVIIPIAPPRGWQHAAQRDGYAQARAVWKAANPGADELAAMREKNRAFCLRALGRTA